LRRQRDLYLALAAMIFAGALDSAESIGAASI
jgi:hypothetical protein